MVAPPPVAVGDARRAPRAAAARTSPLLVVGLVALGVLLPLFGVSLLLVLLLDQLVVRRVPALAGWFDVRTVGP